MPFEKGNTYSLGRPKGAANKSTELVKKSVASLLENNLENLQNDLDQMQPRDRVNALLQFLKFHIPTQKAVEVADVSFDTRTEWIDKIMSYDPNELHKKIADATKLIRADKGMAQCQQSPE